MLRTFYNNKYWQSLVSLLISIVLVLLYFQIDGQGEILETAKRLLLNTIPSLLAVSVGALFVFWFLGRKGLDKETQLVDLLGNKLEEKIQELTPGSRIIKAVYENYRRIPWKEFLADAKRIDIVVYYFDSWAGDNWELLVSVFKNGGTINLIVPNYSLHETLGYAKQVFPEHTPEVLAARIRNTVEKVQGAYEASHCSSASLNVCYYDGFFTYALILIDERIAIYSSYELNRKHKVGNPGIVFDLCESIASKEFFLKEVYFLRERSATELPNN